jgi:hypothetical protein
MTDKTREALAELTDLAEAMLIKNLRYWSLEEVSAFRDHIETARAALQQEVPAEPVGREGQAAIDMSCRFAVWWPRHRAQFTTTKQAAWRAWQDSPAAEPAEQQEGAQGG